MLAPLILLVGATSWLFLRCFANVLIRSKPQRRLLVLDTATLGNLAPFSSANVVPPPDLTRATHAMDLAYDHIAEQTYTPTQGDRATTPTPASSAPNDAASASTTGTGSSTPKAQASTLQTEFQETVKVFSNTAWGARLGGFWGNVRKQGESVYEEARKEAAEMVNEVEALRTKVVGLGFNNINGEAGAAVAADYNDAERGGEKEVFKTDQGKEGQGASEIETETEQQHKTDQETETFLERFKHEAAKRLKEVQKAEDAADEALLRFGTNIRNFLRDAVSVSAPDEDDENAKKQQQQSGYEVLFESRDQLTGKRVIHTSRFDAQLHVIHTTLASFTLDPSTSGGQWEEFSSKFDVEEMTGRIAGDLEKYVELRAAMEKLVPESVEYKDFWARYYFLRHVVEVQEEKRRELLKGMFFPLSFVVLSCICLSRTLIVSLLTMIAYSVDQRYRRGRLG
jgi:hypothetical protein